MHLFRKMVLNESIDDPTPQISKKLQSILNIGEWVGEMAKLTKQQKRDMMSNLFMYGPDNIEQKNEEYNYNYDNEVWDNTL